MGHSRVRRNVARPGRAAASPLRRFAWIALLGAAAAVLLASAPAGAAPLTGASADMDKVCVDPVLQAQQDKTSEANSATGLDFTLGSAGTVGQSVSVYYGMNVPFNTIYVDVGAAGVGGAISWKYHNGADFVDLPGVTDNTNGFRNSGVNTVVFTPPNDWARRTLTCTGGSSYYFIKSLTTTSFTTAPVGDQLSTIAFNLRVKVQDDLGTAITGLTSGSLEVTGGTDNTQYAFREIGSGVYEVALKATGADTNYDLRFIDDAYASPTTLATGSLSTSLTDLTATPYVLQFAYRVTDLTDELGGSLLAGGGAGIQIRAGEGLGIECTAGGNPTAWYCPVSLKHESPWIEAIKDGYVRKVDNLALRSDHTDPQVDVTITNIQFAHKITSVTTEGPGASVTGVEARAGASYGTLCTESGGAWYCAVPLADDFLGIRVIKDGYVTYEGGSFPTDRTAHADAQVTTAVTGVPYAYKVTGVAREGPGGALTGVDIATGDSFGVTCTEAAGAWYCAVPLAHTGLSIRAAKDGYVTSTAAAFATDRTSATDAQVTGSVTGVAYSYRVTGVTTEAGAALNAATVETGDAYGIACDASGGAYYCAVPLAHTGLDVRVAQDGYVTHTGASFATDRTAAADAQVTVAVTDVRYGYKVTSVAAEGPGTALVDATVEAGDGYGTPCVADGGAYFCPVPVADTALAIRVTRDGYVQHTATSFATDRTAATDGQVTASVSGIPFAYKVTGVTREGPGGALTGVTLAAGNAYATACTEDGGAWYCPVPLADTSLALQAAKDGYVTDTASSFATDRTGHADAQVTGTVTNVRFAYKVTSVETEAAQSLTGVTVAAGDAYGTTCAESAGAWYCPVPLADTGTTIRAIKDGYVTHTLSSFASDRTAATDAQVNAAVTGVAYTVRLTLDTETTTAGVTFEKQAAGGGWGALVPTATSGNVAYVAQATGESDVEFRATKYGVTADAGAALTASASAQAQRTISLVATLLAPTTSAANTAAGATTTYTFGAELTHDWDASGALRITFPADFGFATLTATISGADGTATVSRSGQVVTVTRAGDGATTAGGTAVTVALGGVQNPGVSGNTGTFDLALRNAGVTVDTGTGPLVTLTAAALTSLSTSPATAMPGATTTYTFGFTLANAWPADGTLTIVFPNDYGLGSPSVTLTGATGTATASVAGQTVTVTRAGDGATTSAGTAVTVALTAIENPGTDGSYGPFTLTTRTAASVAIDTGSGPSVSLSATVLSLTGLSSSTHPLGTWTTSRTLLVTWQAPEDATVNGYSWGLDATPDNVVDGTGLSATITGVADGTHTFKVKARNSAGVWGPVASYGLVQVDGTAPSAPSIASGSHASGGCGPAAATFTWSATDATSGLHGTRAYAYALNGGALQATTQQGVLLSAIPDGLHTLTVEAMDVVGLTSRSTYTFRVDTSPPALALGAATATRTLPLSVAWAATDSCGLETLHFEFRRAGGGWSPLSTISATGTSATGTRELPGPLEDGVYEFRARGRDVQGIEGTYPSEPQARVQLDRAAPGAPGVPVLTLRPAGYVRAEWTAADDAGSGVAGYRVFRVEADGTMTAAHVGLVTVLQFDDGPYADGSRIRLAVRAVDHAGNEGPTVTSEISPPTVATGSLEAPQGLSAAGLESGITREAPVQLSWLPVHGAHSYAVHAGPAASFATTAQTHVGLAAQPSFATATTADGTYHYAVSALDAIGNPGTPRVPQPCPRPNRPHVRRVRAGRKRPRRRRIMVRPRRRVRCRARRRLGMESGRNAPVAHEQPDGARPHRVLRHRREYLPLCDRRLRSGRPRAGQKPRRPRRRHHAHRLQRGGRRRRRRGRPRSGWQRPRRRVRPGPGRLPRDAARPFGANAAPSQPRCGTGQPIPPAGEARLGPR
jgi:hypothetical protein